MDFLTPVLLTIIASFLAAIFYRGNKKFYLGEMKQFNPQADVTTLLPVPIHSATCDHDWDTIVEQNLEMPHEKRCVIVLACRRCGIIDKTMQVTTPPPPALPAPKPPPPPPCHHEWDVVTESVLDVAHEKKVVVVMTCRKCGQVDKTTEVTSEAPKKEWCKSDCRHKWEADKRVLIDSAYEQMLKSISTNSSYGKSKVDPNKKLDLDLAAAPAWMFKKTYICVRTCSVCGEIDKTIASNFEGEDASSEEDEVPGPIKIKKA